MSGYMVDATEMPSSCRQTAAKVGAALSKACLTTPPVSKPSRDSSEGCCCVNTLVCSISVFVMIHPFNALAWKIAAAVFGSRMVGWGAKCVELSVPPPEEIRHIISRAASQEEANSVSTLQPEKSHTMAP